MSKISEIAPPRGGARMQLAFDESCSPVLRSILTRSDDLVETASLADADLIIFGTDEIGIIKKSPAYTQFRRKCIAITESDIPTFFLPGLYAANRELFLTNGRTRTISYFLSDATRGNTEVSALIGEAVPKTYLYSFMGGVNSWARRRVFRHLKSGPDTLIEATSHYNHWKPDGNPEEQRRRYASTMASSKFSICPRGCGLSSYRLFESMSLGVAPVIIADGWEPPAGIDWSFALFVRESDVRRLDAILRSHESEWQERGQQAKLVYQKEFAPSVVVQRLQTDLVAVAAGLNPARETLAGITAQARAFGFRMYWRCYRAAKYSVLFIVHVTKLPLPIRLHREPGEQLSRLDARKSIGAGSRAKNGIV